MICKRCARTGDAFREELITPSEAQEQHSLCVAGGCDCQHKVGPKDQFISG